MSLKFNTADTKIWFTSDTHFGHHNILTFCPKTRLGKDSDDHDRILIQNWQRDVGQDDIVFILGDFSFSDAPKTKSILDQLPGNKFLIWGNHDKVIRCNYDIIKKFTRCSDYERVVIDGKVVVLFHYPIAEHEMMHRGAYHFYGHVHGKPVGMPAGRTMDVGIDTRPADKLMTLWSWKELDDIAQKGPIRSHH